MPRSGPSSPYGSGYSTGGAGGGGGGGGSGASTLLFGAGSVGSSTTTRYLYPGYDDGLAQTSIMEMDAPFAGTLSDLYVRHNGPAGNGNAIVYTVEVNGIASALAVSLASTGAVGSDTANSVAVVAGDRIRIRVTKAAVIGVATLDVDATMKLQAA